MEEDFDTIMADLKATGFLKKRPSSVSATKSNYDELYEKHGREQGVDPDLLRAMTRQESGFKKKAVSNKGASGLMQLMPETARGLGVKDIFDPDQNIGGGAKYIRQQLDKFGGSVPKALAAYNAGPGAVEKYGGIPPYTETRGYVKNITGNYKGSGYYGGSATSSPQVQKANPNFLDELDSMIGGTGGKATAQVAAPKISTPGATEPVATAPVPEVPAATVVDGKTYETDVKIGEEELAGPAPMFPRTTGKGEYQDDSILGMFPNDPSLDDEELLRRAATSVLSQYGVTPGEVDSWIEDSKAAGKPLLVGNKNAQTVDISAKMLAQIKGPEQARTMLEMEQAQNRPYQPDLTLTEDLPGGQTMTDEQYAEALANPSEDDLRKQAMDELMSEAEIAHNTGDVGEMLTEWWEGSHNIPAPTEEDITARIGHIREGLLSKEETLGALTEGRKYNDWLGNVGGNLFGGGLVASGTDLAAKVLMLAGTPLDYILKPVLGKSLKTSGRKVAAQGDILRSTVNPDGSIFMDVVQGVGATPGFLAEIALLKKIPGMNAVGAFAVHGGLASASRGDMPNKVFKETQKSGALGAVFELASPASKLLGEKTFGAALTNRAKEQLKNLPKGTTAEQIDVITRNAQAAKVAVEHSSRLATITLGTGAVEYAAGSDLNDAAHSMAVMLGLDLVTRYGPQSFGRILRVTRGNKTADVVIRPAKGGAAATIEVAKEPVADNLLDGNIVDAKNIGKDPVFVSTKGSQERPAALKPEQYAEYDRQWDLAEGVIKEVNSEASVASDKVAASAKATIKNDRLMLNPSANPVIADAMFRGGVFDRGLFSSAYLDAVQTEKTRGGLVDIRDGYLKQGKPEASAAVDRLIVEFDKATDPKHGDLRFHTEVAGTELFEKFAGQEEDMHRLNRRSGLRAVLDQGIDESSPNLAKVKNKLNEGYKGPEGLLLDESVAQSLRDDAHAHLGMSKKSVRAGLKDLYNLMETSEIDTDAYVSEAAKISRQGRLLERYGRQRSNAELSPESTEEPTAGSPGEGAVTHGREEGGRGRGPGDSDGPDRRDVDSEQDVQRGPVLGPVGGTVSDRIVNPDAVGRRNVEPDGTIYFHGKPVEPTKQNVRTAIDEAVERHHNRELELSVLETSPREADGTFSNSLLEAVFGVDNRYKGKPADQIIAETRKEIERLDPTQYISDVREAGENYRKTEAGVQKEPALLETGKDVLPDVGKDVVETEVDIFDKDSPFKLPTLARLRGTKEPLTEEGKRREIEQIHDEYFPSLALMFKRPRPAGTFDVSDPNPSAEQRMTEARGAERSTFFNRTYESTSKVINAWRREFSRLDPNKDKTHAAANDLFHQATASNHYAVTRAADDLARITENLDQAQFKVFERLVIARDLEKEVQSGKTPEDMIQFGFNDLADLQKSIKYYEGFLADNPPVVEALKQRADLVEKITTDLVKAELLPAAVLDDPRYFHRQVKFAVNAAMEVGTSDMRLKKKSFQMKRTGLSEDYNTDYLESESEWLANAYGLLTRKQIQDRMRASADISEDLKTQAKIQGVKDWRTLLPEDYKIYQPEKGHYFFRTMGVAEDVINDLVSGKISPMKLKLEAHDILAMGQVKPEWALPRQIANMMENFQPDLPDEALSGAMAKAQATWKQWTLISPQKFVAYNTRNTLGDLDISLAYDPKILTYVPRATADLANYQMRGKLGGPAGDVYGEAKAGDTAMGEIYQAMRFGVVGSGMSVHEIPDIHKVGALRGLTGEGNFNVARNAWDLLKTSTNTRENILRLAAFRYFKDEIAKKVAAGEDVNMYGASTRKQVDAIVEPNEKAAKLARELLGDYGAVSENGRWIRRHMIPFYSWLEINAPRYVRLMKNMPHEGKSLNLPGLVGGTVLKFGYNLGSLAIRMTALSAAMNLYNSALYPDEENALAKTPQGRQPHLILGVREDGTPRVFSAESAFTDALGWFGGQDVLTDLTEISEGKRTFGDQGIEAGKAVVDKVVGGWAPVSRSLLEASFGRSAFPTLFAKGSELEFDTKPIRDPMEHIARTFSLGGLYKRITGRPMPPSDPNPIGRGLDWLLTYRIDPIESVYWNARGQVSEYRKDKGVQLPEGAETTEKMDALYYYKQAVKWGDDVSAERWLSAYKDLGGTDAGIKQSITRAHPLGSLAKADWGAFVRSRTTEQLAELKGALQFYKDTYKADELGEASGATTGDVYQILYPKPLNAIVEDSTKITTAVDIFELSDADDRTRAKMKQALMIRGVSQLKRGTLTAEENEALKRVGINLVDESTRQMTEQKKGANEIKRELKKAAKFGLD